MDTKQLLSIKNLHVSVEHTQILDGINLEIGSGEVHVIMGPNGCGKSTLAYALMGHPAYTITEGTALFQGHDLAQLSPDKRAKAGVFLAFQYPHEIEGIGLRDFLRQSYNALYGETDRQLGIKDFRNVVEEKIRLLGITPSFVERDLNVGFSGGEKKRAEMLQLAVLQPKLAILDEIDSGLDIDALRIVCDGINSIRNDNPEMAIILITHYPRMLQYIPTHAVHVMHKGKIVRTGGKALADELEREGYSLDTPY